MKTIKRAFIAVIGVLLLALIVAIILLIKPERWSLKGYTPEEGLQFKLFKTAPDFELPCKDLSVFTMTVVDEQDTISVTLNGHESSDSTPKIYGPKINARSTDRVYLENDIKIQALGSSSCVTLKAVVLYKLNGEGKYAPVWMVDGTGTQMNIAEVKTIFGQPPNTYSYLKQYNLRVALVHEGNIAVDPFAFNFSPQYNSGMIQSGHYHNGYWIETRDLPFCGQQPEKITFPVYSGPWESVSIDTTKSKAYTIGGNRVKFEKDGSHVITETIVDKEGLTLSRLKNSHRIFIDFPPIPEEIWPYNDIDDPLDIPIPYVKFYYPRQISSEIGDICGISIRNKECQKYWETHTFPEFKDATVRDVFKAYIKPALDAGQYLEIDRLKGKLVETKPWWVKVKEWFQSL